MCLTHFTLSVGIYLSLLVGDGARGNQYKGGPLSLSLSPCVGLVSTCPRWRATASPSMGLSSPTGGPGPQQNRSFGPEGQLRSTFLDRGCCRGIVPTGPGTGHIWYDRWPPPGERGSHFSHLSLASLSPLVPHRGNTAARPHRSLGCVQTAGDCSPLIRPRSQATHDGGCPGLLPTPRSAAQGAFWLGSTQKRSLLSVCLSLSLSLSSGFCLLPQRIASSSHSLSLASDAF